MIIIKVIITITTMGLRKIGYMGLTWFSLGLGNDILRAWKGNTISDPLPLTSSGEMKVSET